MTLSNIVATKYGRDCRTFIPKYVSKYQPKYQHIVKKWLFYEIWVGEDKVLKENMLRLEDSSAPPI